MVSGTHLAFGNNCSKMRTVKPSLFLHSIPGSDFGTFGVNCEEICEAERAQLS